MIRPLAGWMIVQPLLNNTAANDQLRVGIVRSIGDLYDDDIAAKIPFTEGDRICWIEGAAPTHILNETLLLVSLGAPLAYEPATNGDGHDDN
jgi:hypothetical protein